MGQCECVGVCECVCVCVCVRVCPLCGVRCMQPATHLTFCSCLRGKLDLSLGDVAPLLLSTYSTWLPPGVCRGRADGGGVDS